MASVRKHARRKVALANYPKSEKSRKGKRSKDEWQAEQGRLELLIQKG
jgi:hypothetical protein